MKSQAIFSQSGAQPTKAQMMDNQLRQYTAMPLGPKERLTERRIREFLEHYGDMCYVAYSGGVDSEVLLDQVWKINPRIPAVFVDTGLEFPEIREHVKRLGNRVVWLKPKISFNQVIEKYGFPVISKKTSDYIHRVRTTRSDDVRRRHLLGQNSDGSPSKMSKLPDKWQFLVDAPFNCSDKCCAVMKKDPLYTYSKQTGRVPFIGTMAGESFGRRNRYLNHGGCNAFDVAHPQSHPMAFWTKQDVMRYIAKYRLPICSVYGEKDSAGTVTFMREQEDGSLQFCGEHNTGCMFCMFGVHLEKGENRFQRMYRTHPKQWNYCINQLGCGMVLDYIGVKYIPEDAL